MYQKNGCQFIKFILLYRKANELMDHLITAVPHGRLTLKSVLLLVLQFLKHSLNLIELSFFLVQFVTEM